MAERIMEQAKVEALRAFKEKRNWFSFMGAIFKIGHVNRGEYVVTSEYGPIFRIFADNTPEIYAA